MRRDRIHSSHAGSDNRSTNHVIMERSSFRHDLFQRVDTSFQIGSMKTHATRQADGTRIELSGAVNLHRLAPSIERQAVNRVPERPGLYARRSESSDDHLA